MSLDAPCVAVAAHVDAHIVAAAAAAVGGSCSVIVRAKSKVQSLAV